MNAGRVISGAGALLGALLAQGTALAGPTVFSTRPLVGQTGQVEILAGGIDERGRSLSRSGLEIDVDGRPASPLSVQSLSDWATASSEASPSWRPPLAVGLVYLWVDGVPSAVLDGIHAFFQRLPSRTVVYPTIYGRLRQGRARLIAGDISRLDEVPYLDGYRPNMIDAVRMNLVDLANDPASLKILLLVTDGKDFADPKGQGPGDFAALGAELRHAGVALLVTRFRPEADAEQATANLRDLSEAAGGFLDARDQAEELENTLESLGQGVADLQRLELPVPWTWRLFPGEHRITAHLTTPAGERLSAELGTVRIGAGPFMAVAGGAIGLGVFSFFVWWLGGRGRRKRTDPDSDVSVEAVLATAHNLIRRGASAERAAEQLVREYPEAGRLLEEVDEELLLDRRFPYLRTRPGRKRLQEIRAILDKRQQRVSPALPPLLAQVLAEAASAGISTETAAERLSALTTSEERAAFVALDLERLAEALKLSAQKHTALGTPRARGVAVAIQDALRAEEARKSDVSVGWLVRTGGPGRRGETLRLGGERTILGSGAGCEIQLVGDPAVASAHAAISLEGGEYSVEPVGGSVRLEGETVSGRKPLVDGETLEIGSGFFVFKAASLLSLNSARSIGRGVRRN
jgi:hypothetical protein